MRSVFLCGSALVLLLSGCASVHHPPYQRPSTPVPSAWAHAADGRTVSAETIAQDWWRQFQDPFLDQLVARAIKDNADIKVLAARIRVARAGIDEARAGALPSLQAGAGASFEKSTGQKFSTQFNLGTQVNWDMDIWGKVEKGVQAQAASYLASEADWRAGYLLLAASVSTTYFQILQLNEQIDRQQKALAKNQQILQIYEAMAQNGLLPATRLLQQRAEINQLKHDLLELDRLRSLAGNALATLSGIPPGEQAIPAGWLQKSVRVPAVPAGLPSDLLKRRPDIVAAEYRVLEAHNLAGQAKLAQLPSISLTGRGGTASFALGNLLRSFTLGLLPSINFPILDPAVKARTRTTQAQTAVAEEQYRKTVIAAFEEVENALVNLEAHNRQKTELEQQVAHLEAVNVQIGRQLREGLVSQLDVFESERSLLAAQLALMANHQQILADTVTLYKALGGGWRPVAVSDGRE